MSTRYLRAVLAAVIALMLTGVGTAMAAAPSNDEPAGAVSLQTGVPVEFDASEATSAAGDPTDCEGSHGAFPGPYSASVWFQYTAGPRDRQLALSAPTMQNGPDQFLAITFVFALGAGGSRTLVDCTAYGNDATWAATPGTTYLIMEAGLSSDVTGEPDFSDRGGTGTIVIERVPSAGHHYAWRDWSTYSDCGFAVDVTAWGSGMSRLKAGRAGDPTPYWFDNYDTTVITTNPANGKWFVETGRGVYRDQSITQTDGTVYTFTGATVGRPYTLTDMDGNRVYFDRGRLLETFQIDTMGDADPSNDQYVDGSWALLSDNGAHPGFFIEDWCADVVQPLLGD